MCMITRLRLDARLFNPPARRRPGTIGRAPVIGKRQATLAKRLINPKTRWRRLQVTGWYGRGERLVEIVSGTALWHHPGLVREACVLHRLPSTSPAYGKGWNRLRAQTGGKFHTLFDAVSRAMARTPRSSSLVENLNSPLRTYFTLRRHLGGSYLKLLRFFLNHRRFMRSRRAERNDTSPRELMTGQSHPHWLTLLGLGPLQPRRA